MKPIHPALLDPGLHRCDFATLKRVCVEAFSGWARRQKIFNGLVQFCTGLRSVGIPFEVWVDGSLLTEKPMPNDVDVVVFAQKTDVNALDAEKRRLLYTLLSREETRLRYETDVYFVEQPCPTLRSYWRGWFTFDRSEQPRGVFVISIP